MELTVRAPTAAEVEYGPPLGAGLYNAGDLRHACRWVSTEDLLLGVHLRHQRHQMVHRASREGCGGSVEYLVDAVFNYPTGGLQERRTDDEQDARINQPAVEGAERMNHFGASGLVSTCRRPRTVGVERTALWL